MIAIGITVLWLSQRNLLINSFRESDAVTSADYTKFDAGAGRSFVIRF